jgi:hypothetical protein
MRSHNCRQRRAAKTTPAETPAGLSKDLISAWAMVAGLVTHENPRTTKLYDRTATPREHATCASESEDGRSRHQHELAVPLASALADSTVVD